MSQDWEQTNWLADAKSLLGWVKRTCDSPTMIMIRHSERLEDLDVQGTIRAELTDLGHRMAIEFGENLPSGRPIIIFHSPHVRTTQTAERILQGTGSKAGDAKLGGKQKVLLGAPGNIERFVAIAERIGFAEFYHRWADGTMDESTILPLNDYLERLIPATIRRLVEAGENVLHIHVTHDIVVAAAKQAFLDLDDDAGLQIPFLGGFGIAKTESGYIGFIQGEEKQLHPDIIARAREE